MPIDEIFENPTVKKVIFQIRYPNLFYIEDKIGEIQFALMEKLPNTSYHTKRQIVIADIGPGKKLEDIPISQKDFGGKKVWRFESDNKCALNILADSLDLSSEYHKTYDLEPGPKFRDIIEFVLKEFFRIVPLPIVKRIGLRYQDVCPINSRDKEQFREWYNSVFPLDRFDLKDTEEMNFSTIVKRDPYFLMYAERYVKKDTERSDIFMLDFDGFIKDQKAEDVLGITDKLHELISEEYQTTIKEPLIEWMRIKQEG